MEILKSSLFVGLVLAFVFGVAWSDAPNAQSTSTKDQMQSFPRQAAMVAVTQGDQVRLSIPAYLQNLRLRLTRRERGSKAAEETWEALDSALVTDKPDRRAHWVYELSTNEGDLLATVEADSRPRSSIELVQATKERAHLLFRDGDWSQEAIVKLGEEVRVVFRKEHDGLTFAETEAKLEGLTLVEERATRSDDSKRALEDQQGEKLVGVDGKAIEIEVESRVFEMRKGALALVRIAGRLYELAEGRSLKLPFRMLTK